MDTHKNNNRVYFASVLAAILIWSSSFIGTKLAYATFPPITLGAARFVLASILLCILVLCKRQFIKPSLKDMGMIALSGILGIPLYFTMENIGVSLTSASNAALIVASYPAITALLELIIYRVPLTWHRLAGILLAVLGIYLISGSGANLSDKNLLGNLILVLTGVVWSFYSFTTRKVVNKYPALTLSFYQTITGTLCFVPLAFIEKSLWRPPTAATFSTLVYLGVVCSVAAFLLYNFGLRKLSSGTAISLMNLVPVFGVIFSVIILHETVTWRQMAGGVVVITGVMLSVMQAKAKAVSREPE